VQVKVLIAFVATVNGVKYRVQPGDVLALPPGADWLTAGLVEAVAPAPVKKARKSKGNG
jgi:hypothetical protein